VRDFLVQRIIRPLYSGQRWARPSTRPSIAARREGLRFRRNAWVWPAEHREEWILERLRSVLLHARTTPFYRERLDGSGLDPERMTAFADFARLPPLERTDISVHRDSMVLPDVDMQQVWQDSTGGSTGQPTVVLKGPSERGWSESAHEFFMDRIGASPGTRTAFMWGHHLDPVASDAWRDRIRTFVENARWYDCFRLSPDVLERYHRDLCEWQPGCIIAYANALGALARAAERSRIVPRYPKLCLVTGAEKLELHDREKIREVFGRPVHERYGSRDVALLGFQTDPGSTTFEIDWANVLVEPEEDGPLSSILVTKLHADAMPMIRYRIGDLGRFPIGSRPGHPTFELHEVIGREMDRLRRPDGAWLHPAAIPHLMKDYPVLEYQLAQADDYSVTLRVVPSGDFCDRSAEEIRRSVMANLPGIEVRVEPCGQIERTASGKRRLVISCVPPPEGVAT
jgi:phenylacetate-CoA ligase